MSTEYRRDYLTRLPMPLAQLYSRVFNARHAFDRVAGGFHLFDTLIQLSASIALATYLDEIRQGRPRVDSIHDLAERLGIQSL